MGVSERDGRSDQPGETASASSPVVARMTAVDVSDGAGELTGGTGGSVDAIIERQSRHMGNPIPYLSQGFLN
jgi:hypothetical protein